jgi:hypothetical protein
MRRAEDSHYPQLEPDVLKSRVISYEKHLTNKGIQAQDYDMVYELACEIHARNGAKGPFGIDAVLMGADAFLDKKKGIKEFKPMEKVERRKCNSCKGTTLRYVEGKIQYEEKDGKKVALRCEECYEN